MHRSTLLSRFAPYFVALFICTAYLTISAKPMDTSSRGYFREPTIHDQKVVFVAEGDLWSVSTKGGQAKRLTTHPGVERRPKISPDGSQILFDATYEGATELYVMPIDGGLPKRLTWHGSPGSLGARSIGWTSNSEAVYSTRTFSTLPETQLVRINVDNAHPERIPLAQAADAAWGPKGQLWFTRFPFQGSHAKRYKGGTVEQIWYWDSKAPEAEVWGEPYDGTRKSPMRMGDRIAYLSDIDDTMNLWWAAFDGTDARALTEHVAWDIREADTDGTRIVYRKGADLFVLDPNQDTDKKIDIQLVSDFDQLREFWIEKPMDWMTSAHLSPKADRVVLTSRGEVFVFPTGKDGVRVQVTREPGARYRSARFLDDKTLITLSDRSGEVEWWTLPADGSGKQTQITDDGKSLRFNGVPSPDGKWIAHHNRQRELFVTRISDGKTEKIADSQWGFARPAWSSDSKWIAYNNAGVNQLSQIFLYNLDSQESTAITTDRYDSYSPVFSKDGDWLWFLSDRHFESEVSSPWGSRQPDPYFNEQTKLYAIALNSDATFPFDPEPKKEEESEDDEEGEDESDEQDSESEDENDKDEKGKKKKDKKKAVRIELDGITERLYEVPAGHGNRGSLDSNGKALFWLEEQKLQMLNIKRHAEVKTIAEKISSYELSDTGEKMLVRKGSNLYVIAPKPKTKLSNDSKINLAGWKFSINPDESFRQLFLDAWRLHRDYFYDPNMHGVDWEKMRKRYEPLLDRVTDRDEVADVQAMLISELSALHASVSPGDARRSDLRIEGGSLGARLEPAKDGWVIAHIYQTDPDIPSEISPLARPSVDAKVGDIITKIDGQSLTSVHPGQALRNLAGQEISVEFKRGKDTFTKTVTPMSVWQAYDLRYDEWEYTRRLETEAKSDGNIGYVHLRAMGRSNIAEWYREFYPVFDRQGLILDVRHNRGGNIDSWILGKLLRQEWMYWKGRAGKPYWNMQAAFRGHMVVLVDPWTASDGEAFADGFRRLGLGEVIGERTWGGEIWLTSSNRQVDGGLARAAEFGVYKDGEWLIEGIGVVPDIEVINAPRATFDGRDAQLEAAIQYLQEKIRLDPRPIEQPPTYPDKSSGDNR